MKNPWMKWYPSDWRGDQLVRACAPITRYVWMEMLGVMHDAEPYGHLTINGKGMPIDVLSRIIAVDVLVVREAIRELTANGVLSKTNGGVIFSRRMIRDKTRRQTNVDNGARGGNPALLNQEVSSGSDKAQKPEARSQKPAPTELFDVRDGDFANVVDDWPENYFDRFWKLYPPGRKGERQNVMVKLARIRRDGKVTFAKLMAGLSRYVATNPDPQFTPAPMVWLNKRRWDVEFVSGSAEASGLTMLDIATGRRGEKS